MSKGITIEPGHRSTASAIVIASAPGGTGALLSSPQGSGRHGA